jgi:hypothetical protein
MSAEISIIVREFENIVVYIYRLEKFLSEIRKEVQPNAADVVAVSNATGGCNSLQPINPITPISCGL